MTSNVFCGVVHVADVRKEDDMEAQRRGLRGYRIIILAIVGALLAVFGALWVAVIFPALDKMPGDYEQTYQFGGTFSVMNEATMSMDIFPIEQTLAQEAVGTEDGALLIHEVRSVKNAVTGADISAIYGDESTLAINPRTLEFMPQVDERGRWGYFGPPRPLVAGDTFDLWHPGTGQALPAENVGEENFRGMNVLVFEINEAYIPIGTEPMSGMELYLSPQITLWIEPSSGTVVNQTSETVTSIDMMGMMMPVQIANVDYAESTIVNLMGTAESASWMLLWFRTLVPWIAICFGAFLVLTCAVLVAVRNIRKARASKPTHHPRPTSLPLDI
jgi:hypothetical protein